MKWEGGERIVGREMERKVERKEGVRKTAVEEEVRARIEKKKGKRTKKG